MYHIKIINDEIRKYLNKKFDKQVRGEDNKQKNYYKLAYLGPISKQTQRIMQRNRHHTLFFSLQNRISFTIKK